MAQTSNQDDAHYINEELAQAQQNSTYGDGDGMPAEQYSSPEPMKMSKKTTHRGRKSSSHIGYLK